MDVIDKDALDNTGDGIRVEGSDSTVRENSACGNGGEQIVVVGAGHVVDDNVTSDACS